MKILIAGGGTGGHVYPAIAIANELRHAHPDWDIEFAGRHNSIEGRVVPEAGYVIHNLHVAGYERFYNLYEKALVVGRLAIAMKDSVKLLHKVKPDIVIGTGGYISGPITMTAAMSHIPTLVSEQNVIPGFTIKTLSHYVNTVCIPFEDARGYMKHPERCVLTGNPVRREFGLFDRQTARKNLKIPQQNKMVLSMGGSLGAMSINNAAKELMLALGTDPEYTFVHITGKNDYEEYMKDIRATGFDEDAHPNIRILPYTDDMPMMINAADLVISRSGAMSISEINYVGAAAIYIPYPYAVNDHQMKNARFSEKYGAAKVIPDEELNGSALTELVKELLADPTELSAMRAASYELGIRNSAELIRFEIEKLLSDKL